MCCITFFEFSLRYTTTGQSTDNSDHVLACANSGMWPEDVSYPGREEPWMPRQAPCSKARGWARPWTTPARSGWAWTGCSPGTRPWNGTPAPSRWASGRRRPGPPRRRRRIDAGLPCPPRKRRGGAGIWVKGAADLWISSVRSLSQRN